MNFDADNLPHRNAALYCLRCDALLPQNRMVYCSGKCRALHAFHAIRGKYLHDKRNWTEGLVLRQRAKFIKALKEHLFLEAMLSAGCSTAMLNSKTSHYDPADTDKWPNPDKQPTREEIIKAMFPDAVIFRR